MDVHRETLFVGHGRKPEQPWQRTQDLSKIKPVKIPVWTGEGGAYEMTFLTQELPALGGCRGREGQFSSVMWPLRRLPMLQQMVIHPPMHIQEAPSRLSVCLSVVCLFACLFSRASTWSWEEIMVEGIGKTGGGKNGGGFNQNTLYACMIKKSNPIKWNIATLL